MKYNKIILSIGAFTALIAFGAATSVSAYQGDYTQTGPGYSAEREAAMSSAFENNDYDAWVELMDGRGRVTQVINEDNFAQFAEANLLASEGNYAEADIIRAELGLKTSDGTKVGAGYGGGEGQGGNMNRAGNRGANSGANYVDADGDGICDNLQ